MGREAPLEGVARLGAVLGVVVGSLAIVYSVLGLQIYTTAQLHLCSSLGCVYVLYSQTQVPLLVLGCLSIAYSIPLWSRRKWGGSLGLCVAMVTAFYTLLFPPLVPTIGFARVGMLIALGATASATCIAIAWRDLV